MNNIFSYSQVSRFQTCPAAYKYNKELKALPSEAMEAGSANHELIAAHLKNPEQPLEIGGARLKAFIKFNLKNITGVEEKINFNVLGYDYTGIIDAYAINGQTALIVDWKSNKNSFIEEKQLKLYALALTQKYPELQYFDCRFWFIGQDYSERFEFTRDEIDEFSGELIDGAAAIENETEFAPTPGGHCKFCAFVAKCPVNQKFEVPVIGDLETATELLKKVFVVEAAADQARDAIKEFMLTNDVEEIAVTDKDRFYIYNSAPQLKSGKIKPDKKSVTEKSSTAKSIPAVVAENATSRTAEKSSVVEKAIEAINAAYSQNPESPDPLDATDRLFVEEKTPVKQKRHRESTEERIKRLSAMNSH